VNSPKDKPPAQFRKRKPAPGGTAAQQFAHFLDRLAWRALPTEEFLGWRHATPTKRRRRRGEIWQRFVEQRDNPATRPALIDRLKVVFDNDEIVILLRVGRLGALEIVLPPALAPQPRPLWGGPWGRPWGRSSPLARALAGIGVPSASAGQDLAAILAGVAGER
jgi:hypothetical protein